MGRWAQQSPWRARALHIEEDDDDDEEDEEEEEEEGGWRRVSFVKDEGKRDRRRTRRRGDRWCTDEDEDEDEESEMWRAAISS